MIQHENGLFLLKTDHYACLLRINPQGLLEQRVLVWVHVDNCLSDQRMC